MSAQACEVSPAVVNAAVPSCLLKGPRVTKVSKSSLTAQTSVEKIKLFSAYMYLQGPSIIMNQVEKVKQIHTK